MADPSSNNSSSLPLVLIDGLNLLWRAAFGFPARIKNRRGEDITAAFGFFSLLGVALRHIAPPQECIVCFDGQSGAQARQQVDEEYKQNRNGLDFSHLAALPFIKKGLDSINISWIELETAEADDLIATLAHKFSTRHVYIVSTDRDFYQLINAVVSVLNTQKRADHLIGPSTLISAYGVTPEQWCDFRALTGDPADNISGIRGIGPKTAARLLKGGARLEDLRNCRKEVIGERLMGSIEGAWDELFRWRELLRLKSDLPIPDGLVCNRSVILPFRARSIMESIGLA
jgi:DNA polymerase-1